MHIKQWPIGLPRVWKFSYKFVDAIYGIKARDLCDVVQNIDIIFVFKTW